MHELIELTQTLLDSISKRDWVTYASLCAPNMTCFEPESHGQLVEGMEFHKYYFEGDPHTSSQSTICSPKVISLNVNAAAVVYSRLIQFEGLDQTKQCAQFEETRIWSKATGNWKLVHLHRSQNCK